MKKRRLARLIAELRALADELEEWQDADRTFTPIELSKEGPGWVDY